MENKNLEELIKQSSRLQPGQSKVMNISYANVDGVMVVVQITSELSADEIFERSLRTSKNNVIPFIAGTDSVTKITGMVSTAPFKERKSAKKSKFTLFKERIISKIAQTKEFLGTPEYNLDYYVDEQGRTYEIDENGTRVYFDARNPEFTYDYRILVDEDGKSWEYVVLEGGIIGRFRNPERTIIEVEGHCYLVDENGINYDCEIDLPPIRR